MLNIQQIPHFLQLDAMDCGPTCLRMISKYYGRNYTLQTLREHSFITREGVSMLGISDAAEAIGFRAIGVKIGIGKLKKKSASSMYITLEPKSLCASKRKYVYNSAQ